MKPCNSNMYLLITILFIITIQINLIKSDAFSVPVDCLLKNEHYFCGTPCPENCSTLTKPCQIASIRCGDKCYCNPGYSRDDREDANNQACIPSWECFKTPTCPGENEEFLPRGGYCQNKCSRLNIPCPIQYKLGQPGCYCSEGFARNFLGVCIAENGCRKEQCDDMYEDYKLAECDKTCENLGICKKGENLESKNGCYCQQGYFRGPDGKCIQQWECPKNNTKL